MNEQNDLIGVYRRTFASRINELTKAENPILDSVPFREEIGENFQVPVDLVLEQAFTAAVNTTTPSGTGYGGYLDPINGLTDRALVTPFSIHGRASISYNAVNEAKKAGDKAIVSALQHVIRRTSRSHAKRLEIQLLRGRRGVGVVESQSGSGTTRALVISEASWAEGLWSGMVGARLDIYTSAYVKSAQTTTMTVTSVVPSTRTVNVSGTAATALDLAVAGTVLTFETALIGAAAANTNEMPGLKFWSRNTGSLFNLDASAQPLWAGNTPNDSMGTPSLSKFIEALTAPSSYGLVNALSIAIINPATLNVLISDQAALRNYPTSEKTGRNGFSMLEFNVQTGTLRMQPHAYQAKGEADMYCPDSVERIGSTEIDFIQRGGRGEEKLILESATSPSAEMRSLSNQTLFCNFPRHNVSVAGITY